jgi:hypothetical protein
VDSDDDQFECGWRSVESIEAGDRDDEGVAVFAGLSLSIDAFYP